MTKPYNGPVPLSIALQKKVDALGRKVKAHTEQERDQDKNKSVNELKATPNLRQPPKGDDQSDFFVPNLYHLGIRDNRNLMDVAVFRLSKRKKTDKFTRYQLTNGYVEVKFGPEGIASIWDYDIVLMMISYLTEAMNRYRDGKGKKPSREFSPHVSDILKFCRKGDGTRQFTEAEASLVRLKGTIIKSERKVSRHGKTIMREIESEGLISRFQIISRTKTGRVSRVKIEVPYWIYREVTEGKQPDVLAVHHDYFLITSSIGRFVYRLARRAAGKSSAYWSFLTIYERSGSSGTLKKFKQLLREIISADDLPEYTLQEKAGKNGPLLIMQHRNTISEVPL